MLLINEKVTNTKFTLGNGEISTDQDGLIDVPQDLVEIFLSSGFRVAETKKTRTTKTKTDTVTTAPVTTETPVTTTAEVTTTTTTTTTTEPRRRWRRKNDD
ncbi:hypothetical protein EBR78_09135 [bacterium]|nr:hypothetical protein [bacterium]